MRVLVIGTGSIGRRHMRTIQALRPDVRFDVLRERPPKSNIVEEDVFFTVSSSLTEAISKRPQLMVIANPSALHLPLLEAAIGEGIPFYAEKPVVSSIEDLDALKKCICEHEMLPPNIVGCNLRFLPSLQALKKMIESGDLGNIVHASFEAGQWLPDWRPDVDYRTSYSARKSLGGGVALDLIHELDSARWILGELYDVQAIFAKASALEIDVEDSASFLMRSRLGALVSVHVNYVSRSPFRRYRIVGDHGTAEWDLPSRTLSVTTREGTRAVPLGPDAFDISQTYIAAMSELLRATDEQAVTSQGIEDGISALELIFRSNSTRLSRYGV